MSWLPAMMFMRMLDDDELNQPKQGQDPEEQYPTRCDAGYTPVVTEICPPVTANNSTQRTPTVATRTWHHTATSAATFTLSVLLAYVATEAIFKCIRGRN